MLQTIFLIFIFFAILAFTIFMFFSFGSFFFGGPFVPSNNEVVEKALDLAELKEGVTFCDLGSGDGRLLVKAAKRGALAIGYELNPFWFLISKIRVSLNGLNDKVAIRRENFYEADFGEADVFYIYLFPEAIVRLEKELKKKAKKGARVIAYRLPFPDWKEQKKFEKEKLYLYIKE